MAFGAKSLEQITEADLVGLIENGETESKTIEYKRDRIGASDGERKEFLYDVSSFANAAGGHLVIGMKEVDGKATALIGLSDINPDAEIARLEQIARDGIRPPIPGLQSTAVPLSSGGFAVVISIPKSWNPPHQVTYQKAFRFYGRDTNGKYQIDVDELRSVFAFSMTAAERLRSFRVERIGQITSGDSGAILEPGAKVVVQVAPISGFASPGAHDLSPLWNDPTPLVSARGTGGSHRYNIDGIVFSSPGSPVDGYVQVFRSGVVEVVESYSEEARRRLSLPSLAFERDVIRSVNGARKVFSVLGVQPPFVIMLTLLSMKGWTMSSGDFLFRGGGVFDRDPTIIPELLLESLDGDLTAKLKPLLDLAWNAAGWPGSIYYDQSGNRAER